MDSSIGLKGPLMKMFIPTKTFKTAVFRNKPWKMYEVICFRSLYIVESNSVTFIKQHHYRPLPDKFPNIYFRIFRGDIFFGIVFAEVGNSGLKPLKLHKKRQFCKLFGKIFGMLEHRFLCEQLQKSIRSEVLVR